MIFEKNKLRDRDMDLKYRQELRSLHETEGKKKKREKRPENAPPERLFLLVPLQISILFLLGLSGL